MQTIRSISAILLAILVLVSSTSFIVGFHICMGKIQNIALFTKADSCEKEESLPPCHRHQKAPCCDDETFFHKGDNFKASVDHIYIVAPTPIDVEQPMVLVSEIIPGSPIARFRYYYYDPPLRSCDLTVEHQVFLI
jgi:hypothetical protein